MASQRSQAESLFFQSNALLEQGDLASAEVRLRQALRLAPDFAEAWANLAWLLSRRQASDAAETCYRHAIALDPSQPETQINLGALLAAHKRFDAAESAYKSAIAIHPEGPAAWSNLGVLYACQQRDAEAEQCYRNALSLDADYAMARFNYAYILLRQGRFEQGWACLEARDWYAGLAAHLTCPRWQGESLVGKSLLIGIEAGHGDMIQFCRYAPLLKAQGAAHISLLCHPALARLFATLEGVDQIISLDQPWPAADWDYWTPALSLPGHCRTHLDSIPAPIPYLHATPERLAHWRPLLPTRGFRVGLCWKGNPLFENDEERSLPELAVLAPLWQVPQVNFVSLQKGAGQDEPAAHARDLPMIDLGSGLVDFADAAAVVAQLDLIICVDTAIAHLAGALGRPCWLLLPAYKPDWRWLMGRQDSPWYPSLRLFQQTSAGQWPDVVARLTQALEQISRSQPPTVAPR